MVKKLVPFLCFTIGLFFCQCTKYEVIDIEMDIWSTGDHITLRKIYFKDDQTIFACGGIRYEAGYIYRSFNAGEHWGKTELSYPKCVYEIKFLNDSIGYAGADDTYIFYTTDLGDSWHVQWHDSNELPFHEFNRTAIRKIQFLNESLGYFTGGENYNKGIIYKTIDGGNFWTYDTLLHELRGLDFTDELNGLVAGFGYIGKTTDGGSHYEQIESPDDFFISILTLQDNSIIVSSNTGAIYKSYNQGTTWIRIQKGNGIFNNRIAFNDMVFDNEIGYIVGNEGLILKSSDYGNTWKKVLYDGKEHLNCIAIKNKKVLIGGENGIVLSFQSN